MLDVVLLFINNKNNKSTTAICSQHQQIVAADQQPAEQEQGKDRAGQGLQQGVWSKQTAGHTLRIKLLIQVQLCCVRHINL